MDTSQGSKQWQVMHYMYDQHDRNPGAGFPTISDLEPIVGLSRLAVREIIDQCVEERLAYLFANAADPCIGLTDAGRAYAKAVQ